jgi:hypothetical protein
MRVCTDPPVIAAALPETRADALNQLAWIARNELIRTPDSVAALLRLSQLDRGCEGEVSELFELGRFEDLIERARACGDRHTEHTALVRLGRYAEATAIAEPGRISPHERAIVAFATGRWFDAAAVDEITAISEAQGLGIYPTAAGS